MARGTPKRRARQEALWMATDDLPRTAGIHSMSD